MNNIKQWLRHKWFNFFFNKYSVRLYWISLDKWIIDWYSRNWFIEYKELSKKEKEQITTIQNCNIRIDHNWWSFMPFKLYWIISISSINS